MIDPTDLPLVNYLAPNGGEVRASVVFGAVEGDARVAGMPAALCAGIKAGADTVYRGFADETNGCNFSGPYLSYGEKRERIAFAPVHGAKVVVANNTSPHAGNKALWHTALTEVETAGAAGAGAVFLADLACSPMPRPIIQDCG